MRLRSFHVTAARECPAPAGLARDIPAPPGRDTDAAADRLERDPQRQG